MVQVAGKDVTEDELLQAAIDLGLDVAPKAEPRQQEQIRGVPRESQSGLGAISRGVAGQVLQGATLGAADELIAGAAAAPTGLATMAAGAARGLPQLARGRIGFGQFLQGASPQFGKQYDRILEDVRGETSQFGQKHPVLSTILNISGAIPTALAVPATAGPKLAGAAARVPGIGASLSRSLAAMTPTAQATRLQRAAGLAAAGATEGGIAGFLSGEGGADRRGQSGLAGSLLGGVSGVAIPAIASAGGRAARGLGNLLGRGSEEVADKFAREQLGRAALRSGMSPHDVGVASERAVQEGIMPFQGLGEQFEGLAEQVAMRPGEGSEIITQRLVEQAADRPDRVAGHFMRTLGDPAAFKSTVSDLAETRARVSKPLYDAAMEVPVSGDRLQTLMDDPIVKKGIKRGIDIQKREMQNIGMPFDATDYSIKSVLPDGTPILNATPNMRTWNIIKKGIDDIIDRELTVDLTGKLKGGEYVNSVIGKKKAILEELDRQNPVYRQAREAWGGLTESMSALDKGRKFAKGDKEDLARTFGELGASDRRFFRMGVARQLQEIVEKTKDTPTAAAISKFWGRRDTRDRLRAVFDNQQQFDDFARMMEQEQTIERTGARALGNSATARRQLAAQDFETGNIGVDAALDVLGGASTPRGAIGGLLRGARRLSAGAAIPEGATGIIARQLTGTAQPTGLGAYMQQAQKQALDEIVRRQIMQQQLAAGAGVLAGRTTGTIGGQ